MASKRKVLYVATPVQKALFDLCIRPEFDREGGKWAGPRIAAQVEPWKSVDVVVNKRKCGRNFEAAKTNFNINDSNWVNPKENLEHLMTVAIEANGGKPISKKELVTELVDLKATFARKAA